MHACMREKLVNKKFVTFSSHSYEIVLLYIIVDMEIEKLLLFYKDVKINIKLDRSQSMH